MAIIEEGDNRYGGHGTLKVSGELIRQVLALPPSRIVDVRWDRASEVVELLLDGVDFDGEEVIGTTEVLEHDGKRWCRTELRVPAYVPSYSRR